MARTTDHQPSGSSKSTPTRRSTSAIVARTGPAMSYGPIERDQIQRRADGAVAADPSVGEPSARPARRDIGANGVDAHRRPAGNRLSETRRSSRAAVRACRSAWPGSRWPRRHSRPAVGIGERRSHVRSKYLGIGVGAERERHLDELQGVGEADLGVALRHGPAFALVRVEQIGLGAGPLDRGELPREIVRVLHAGIESEPAGRREPVRGVADEEDAAVAKAGRDLRGHRPRRDRDDVRATLGVRRARHARVARIARVYTTAAVLGVRVVGVHVHPFAVDVVRDERAARRRITDPEQDPGPVADEVSQVGREMHHHEALEAVRALGLDAEHAPHRTRRAVAREQPAARHTEQAVGVPRSSRSRPSSSLVADFPAMSVAHAYARLGERVDEQRLQVVLGEVAQGRRRHASTSSPWRS